MKTARKRVLFICGSMNQTTQMHQIAQELPDVDAWFTPYYCDGALELCRRAHLLESTILGHKLSARARTYLRNQSLSLDEHGAQGPYDLVVTCSDLIVPRNIRQSPIVLVQEGMTDPETIAFRLIRRFRWLPRWIASTAGTGLSDQYDVFCVASQGYAELFASKGVRPEKLVVTGIPNYDNAARSMMNDFPRRHYVLVCTSDVRETWGWENRKRFIRRAVEIAGERQLIFKLHPNERFDRATREIHRYAPGALVYTTGNTDEMIANCDVLITRFSTVAYIGLALGKEVHSSFDINLLRRLLPVQNACAARNIAQVCRKLLDRTDANQTGEPREVMTGRRERHMSRDLRAAIRQSALRQ